MANPSEEEEVSNTPHSPRNTLPSSRSTLNTITLLPYLVTVKLTHENDLLWKA